MESTRSRPTPAPWLDRLQWGEAAVFVLAAVPVAFLGLEGGGYDPLVHDQVGILVWWLLLVGVAVGAMPRRRLGGLAWAALGLLTAFALWTALSLAWTDSVDKTFAELARVGGYVGFFALALFLRGRDDGRRLLGGVGTGVAIVAGIALLSRFEPSWFPAGAQTSQLLNGNEERLSYPIHYWNGLAALVAIGMPLLLLVAVEARSALARALAAAALPALMLTSFLTLSRGGIGAAVIALALFLALAADRLPKVLTLLTTGVGGAVLCLAVSARDELHDGVLNATAESQGDEMLLFTVIVCVVAGAVQLAISAIRAGDREPRRARSIPRRAPLAAAAAILLVALLAVGASGQVADAWEEFKQPDSPGQGSGRLISASGQNRYAYWQETVDQNASSPLVGTGSGTFEYWWARNRDAPDVVQDAHSLYLQTLGELGIVGLALLAAFIAALLIGGVRAALHVAPRQRSLPTAALAAVSAFFIAAAVDWLWQIPVLVVAMIFAAAVLVAPGRDEEGTPGAFPPIPRLGFAAAALIAIVAIAIPLSATSGLRASEASVRDGDLIEALEQARSAQNVEPAAAAPRLQQALVLEQMDALAAAAAAARSAAEREEKNWRNWLVLSRIEAQRGRTEAALSAYRRARSLNPLSPIFDR